MLQSTSVRTRFAPSPTGDLHLGSAFTAVASWWLARSRGGETVLRVEDIDRVRVVVGSELRQLEDLAWLELDYDEGPAQGGRRGPYRQTERLALYQEALQELATMGRTYPCDCSRAEIARAASAPHEGEEVAYPGTCRDKDPARPMRRPPAIRLRIEPEDAVDWCDAVAGSVPGDVLHKGGDFVLRRGDGGFAYQLAVAADDLAMGVTDVVRGDDLIPSTPRQTLLMRLWAKADPAWARGDVPRYWHVPLVRGADGKRLAKRAPFATLRDLRQAGVSPEVVLGRIATALGVLPRFEPVRARDLGCVRPGSDALRCGAWTLPATWS